MVYLCEGSIKCELVVVRVCVHMCERPIRCDLVVYVRDLLDEDLKVIWTSTGAWILTSGLRFGITKHLGQAVRDHSLASTNSKVRVVAIGIAPWTQIHNREILLQSKVRMNNHQTRDN